MAAVEDRRIGDLLVNVESAAEPVEHLLPEVRVGVDADVQRAVGLSAGLQALHAHVPAAPGHEVHDGGLEGLRVFDAHGQLRGVAARRGTTSGQKEEHDPPCHRGWRVSSDPHAVQSPGRYP
ncbi:MAG: hypothetical protein H6736_04610 [Alphaproteobacteria bacterium]|nr:hypothetical protein [Alphaproteobacteria bacterium]